MGKNDRKCMQCEEDYAVSRDYFGKQQNSYCPTCSVKIQKVTIEQLNKRLDKLTDQMDRANKASTILCGSEYFDDPAFIIESLQDLLRGAQKIASEKIIKLRTTWHKMIILEEKLLNMGSGVVSLLDLVLKQKQDAGLWFTPLGDEEERIQMGLTALHDKIMDELQDLTGGKKRNVSR